MTSGLDLQILLWINGWVAASPTRFYAALRQSARLPWLLGALLLTGLWFLGERGVVPSRPGGLTRFQARRRILLGMAALVSGLLSARLIQAVIARTRPLVDAPLRIPVEPHGWETIRAGLDLQGAFPSDHAVMFFTLAALTWALDRRVGILGLVYALYFSILRIGIGFHWPSDILSGAALALFWTAGLLRLEKLLASWLDQLVLQFELRPGVAYALAFLFMYDFSNKFSGLFGILKWLAGKI